MYGINSVLFSSCSVARCRVRFYSNKNTKKLLEFLADMPKANSARITEAQRQRQNISKKSDKYAPSTVYLQAIGSGARGAPNTLYLFTDQKRYLFNCGECTQRLAHEHKVKLSRLDHIFITSKSWRNIGGLPGLSLTLQDVGVPNITLHGPEGLDELFYATKRFVVMKDMNISMAKCTPNEDFEDNALSVKYVLLGNHDSLLTQDLKPATKKPKLENTDNEFEEFVHDDTDYYRREKRLNHKSINAREKSETRAKKSNMEKVDPQKKKTEKVLHDLQKKSHCTVAYICTLKKRLGTLDLAKCVERGVKPGPMLGQLKSGQDVVLPDGTLILSKDVKTPDDPGPVFIVLEVPDISYLKESEFSAHFDNGQNSPENIPTLVVHYTPPHVFNHLTYRTFMSMFGPSTQHLVLNTQNNCLGSEAVHRTQHKLHLLDSDIFPQLKDVSVPAVWNSSASPKDDGPTKQGLEELKNKIALAQFQNIINMEGSKGDAQACTDDDGTKVEVLAARTLTQFHLRPRREVDRSAEPKLHIQEYIKETMDMDGFVGSLEQFRQLVDNKRYGNEQKEYPKVVFLGTGSCIPSKTRNTSAIVLQIDENRSMLMDCGEGTFGQLVRFYGPKKVNAFLRTLRAIYVSHLHADHHIGLIGVLQARREAFDQSQHSPDPIHLLAPGQIYTWLSMYDQQFEAIKQDFTLIPNQGLLEDAPPHPSNSDLTAAVLASIGVNAIRTCLVSHCPNAFGVAIDIDGTHKLTYSGDTIPCDALAKIGQNSTLLIHEATMEDELADEARIKMHSTTSQAIDMGRLMNAKYTVLTHFSQRYARLPRLSASILNDNNTVGIAFDNMQITMSDLELLPHMYAPLQLMFAEHCVEMEMKAAHRARHKQRQERTSGVLPTSVHRQDADIVKPLSASVINRVRQISPGCRRICSSPPKYRESNASRLRQELKGMTVSGVVKGLRSQSASPVKRADCASPTPRTMSETSHASQEVSGKFHKTPPILPSAYIVDTRSKTINTAKKSNAGRDRDSKIFNKNLLSDFTGRSHLSTSGYGRPLVTPINKRLSVRRDNLPKNSAPSAKSPICRTTSPKPLCRVAHSGAFSSSHSYDVAKPLLVRNPKVDMVTSVLVHIIMWRSAHVAYYFFKTCPCMIALIAIGVVFWTATKETVSANMSLKWKDSGLGVISKGPVKPHRPSSSSMSRETRSPTRSVKSADIKRQDSKASANKISKQMKSNNHSKDLASQPGVHLSPARSIPSKIPKKIEPGNALKRTSLRNNSTENLKQQFCSHPTQYSPGRPTSAIHSSTRSFKPQLEDIKSSFLLLNQTHNNIAKNQGPKRLKENDEPVHNSIFDDNKRRHLLNESRKKFQCKRFFNDSRYDKIEGLNWITWKI